MAVILRIARREKNLFENGVQRMVFGGKIERVRGHCRRKHNDKLRDLHFSPNNIRRIKSGKMRCSGKGARVMGRGITYRILVGGKPEGKRTLGRNRQRWVGNIKMDIQEML